MAKPQNADDEDWRLQGVMTVTGVPENTAVKAQPGDVLKVSVSPRQLGGDFLLGLPNATALFLDMAQKAQKQADDLRKEAFQRCESRYLDDKRTFAYFQEMMSAVVFAFTALESFANEGIPDSYQHVKKWKAVFLSLGKHSIERQLSLVEKLGDVLPRAQNIDSPKGTMLWQRFLELKDIRDRIVHLKTPDQRSPASGPESLWEILMNPDLPSYARIAIDVVAFFHAKKAKPPRWFEKIPF